MDYFWVSLFFDKVNVSEIIGVPNSYPGDSDDCSTRYIEWIVPFIYLYFD